MFHYCLLVVSVFPLGSGPSAGCYPFGKENSMPSVEVSAPVSSVASDRFALGVGWVRPGVAGIGGTLNPSGNCGSCCGNKLTTYCFEGNEE